MLTDRNFELKKQALNLVTKMKNFLANQEKEDSEYQKEITMILKENEIFKKIMTESTMLPILSQKEKEGPPSFEQIDTIPLEQFKEKYKGIKEERKEMKEKLKNEEKKKEKTSQIFSYFQNPESSLSDLNEQNSIIDMYEEKILQNSIRTLSSEDKSPKLLNNFKKK